MRAAFLVVLVACHPAPAAQQPASPPPPSQGCANIQACTAEADDALNANEIPRALNALNRNQQDYPDLKVDRAMGARTLGAFRAFRLLRGPAGDRVLLKALESLQGERYIHLAEQRPANEAFLYGWIANRIG